MNKFKFGIFDFDGNIVNAMPAYTKVFSEILRSKYGIGIKDSGEYYLNSTGTPIDVQFKCMLEKYCKPTDIISKLVDEFFDTVNKIDFVLFEGAKDTIEKLFDRGLKLFITTGSQTADTKKRLEKAGLIKYFSLALGSSEISKGPMHIKKFAESVELTFEDFSKQAFYRGDGPRDMEIAKMSGIYAIGIAQTVSKEKLLEAGADIAVGRIRDITELDILK